MLKFSITIEATEKGLSYWTQSGVLSKDERSRFDALKKQIQRICQPPPRQLIISEKPPSVQDGKRQKEFHPLR